MRVFYTSCQCALVWACPILGINLASAPPNSGFLNLSTRDLWGRVILCCRGRPGHCRVFSSASGLHPLDAPSTFPLSHLPPPHYDNWNVSRHCPGSPGRRKLWLNPTVLIWQPSLSIISLRFCRARALSRRLGIKWWTEGATWVGCPHL